MDPGEVRDGANAGPEQSRVSSAARNEARSQGWRALFARWWPTSQRSTQEAQDETAPLSKHHADQVADASERRHDRHQKHVLILSVQVVDPGYVTDFVQKLSDGILESPLRVTLALADGSDARQREPLLEDMQLIALPKPRTRSAAEAWLREKAPDLVVWWGPPGPDVLMEAILALNLNAVALGMTAPEPASGRARRNRKQILGAFKTITTDTEAAAAAVRKIVPQGTPVRAAGPAFVPPEPPKCNVAERDDFAAQLNARPVWLAEAPTPEELPHILEAHRMALRTSHRLLLMIAPREDDEGPDLARLLSGEGWRVARRSMDEDPSDATEIYIADSRDEIGLWVRVAPVTFLGGSLTPGAAVADPGPPASLGSAIISGPVRTEPHGFWAALVRAGAVHEIASPPDLGPALSDLQVPDIAAMRAHEAWRLIAASSRAQELYLAEVRAALQEDQ